MISQPYFSPSSNTTPSWFERMAGRDGLLFVYLSFAFSILGIVGIACWSAMLDFNETRNSLLQAEVNILRSHAIRTAFRMQESLVKRGTPGDLTAFDDKAWLKPYWGRAIAGTEAHLYAAIVDKQGTILLHSSPGHEGKTLPLNWYRRRVPEAGDDVTETDDPSLTDGVPALDICIPILHQNQEIGAYHSGFNVQWFEQELKQHLSATRQRWTVTTILIVGIVVMACVASVSVSKRIAQLHSRLALGHVRKLAELGQVAGGIAHEIRNPLNAVRLNLHYLERLWQGNGPMCEQTAPIIKETIDEIERVDAMLRALLQYARPEKAHAEVLDPVAEIQAVLTFMLPLLERDGIRIDTQMSSSPLRVYIDRARLRQVILNLLTNSVEATGPHGYIRISVVPHDQAVAINVADSGSGVPVAAREKIFEPFYSSKELGTGLGLALVKRFVEEAGGSVRCHSAPEGGAEFRVTLPASRETDESARQPRAIAQAGAAELADASST